MPTPHVDAEGRTAELPGLSPEEQRRYARHFSLADVGPDGQRRLKAARVALVGAGGLGSPAALYLAAAGVGTLGLIDFDRVDETNLQRQILFGSGSIGAAKVEAAAERLRDLNPHTTLECIGEKLSSTNALEILGAFDLVVDGSDNFPTRYLVNDACVLLGKADVYGSIFRFDGQVSVFDARHGPCYRCLFREPPPPHLVPSCAEAGVLGVLPGIIGSLQALEAIKLILDAGDALIGRLLMFEALPMRFREIGLRRDPDCPICGERPSVTELIDYDAFCGITPNDSAAEEEPVDELEISVHDSAAAWREGAVVLIDVREPHEWQICSIDGAAQIPLRELSERVGELELDPEAEIVTYCHTGVRSLYAVQMLRAAGFAKARSMRGGINAWSAEIDPAMPRY